ncbi:MAG: type IV secretion system DNA-binding domain-containing protein [Patescibacteria group bacterium]|jgi:CxxC-x17-CxxC domain-containing protein
MPELTPYDHDHENEVSLFAETNYRNNRTKFGIKTDDRRRHVYVIGKTGMGKTTLLENFVLNDIYAGHGLAYVDPHGDTAQKLLDYIPSNRINDVVYFNPGDMDFPIGFNILETVDPSKKHLVAAGLMGVFKKIWPDVWSARMEYILLNTILALLDAPGSTLLGINRLLVDEDYRKRVVSLCQDPVVKTFWVKEFAAFSEKYRTEAIAPVQNKVGQFLSASIIRNIVAQVKSTIDVREIMDKRKIFILNLAKGLIGEENSRLLGGMIVTRLQLAAMERVDMPEKERQDFYLYVDEFQNFATTSFANILSEARKYRLNLIVAHQYIEQLEEEVRDAIFGNVGTIISFRVGAADAQFMETEFTPRFTPEDLVNLGKYDTYLKLMIDGASSEPFSATTLPPIAQRTGSAEKVIKVSRERNARPRADIESKVLRWSGMGTSDEGAVIDVEDDDEALASEEKLKELQATSPKIAGLVVPDKKPKKMFEIACSVCGKIQQLSFEPDWSRPWFCKEDLEKRKLSGEGDRPAASATPVAVAAPRPPAVQPPKIIVVPPRPPVAAKPLQAAPPPKKIEPQAAAPAAPSVSLAALLGKDLTAKEEMEVIEEVDDEDAGDGTGSPKIVEKIVETPLASATPGGVGLVSVSAKSVDRPKPRAVATPVAPRPAAKPAPIAPNSTRSAAPRPAAPNREKNKPNRPRIVMSDPKRQFAAPKANIQVNPREPERHSDKSAADVVKPSVSVQPVVEQKKPQSIIRPPAAASSESKIGAAPQAPAPIQPAAPTTPKPAVPPPAVKSDSDGQPMRPGEVIKFS